MLVKVAPDNAVVAAEAPHPEENTEILDNGPLHTELLHKSLRMRKVKIKGYWRKVYDVVIM